MPGGGVHELRRDRDRRGERDKLSGCGAQPGDDVCLPRAGVQRGRDVGLLEPGYGDHAGRGTASAVRTYGHTGLRARRSQLD